MGESKATDHCVQVEVDIIEAEITSDRQQGSADAPDPDAVYEGSEPDTAHQGAKPGAVYEGGAPGMSNGSAKEEAVYEGAEHEAQPGAVYEGVEPSEGAQPHTQHRAKPGAVYEGETPGETDGELEKQEAVYEG